MKTRILAGAWLALCCGVASGASADFDAHYAKARENLASEAGAAYDRQLGASMDALPHLKRDMAACAEAHQGLQDAHGYLEFTTAQSYQVILQPDSDFSRCLAKALSGHAVPAPPSLPWFNHFSFSVQGN